MRNYKCDNCGTRGKWPYGPAATRLFCPQIWTQFTNLHQFSPSSLKFFQGNILEPSSSECFYEPLTCMALPLVKTIDDHKIYHNCHNVPVLYHNWENMTVMATNHNDFSCDGTVTVSGIRISLSGLEHNLHCNGPKSFLQGDHSGCAKPPVEIKTKVAF